MPSLYSVTQCHLKGYSRVLLCRLTVVGSVLIFVTKKANCEELANNLKHSDFNGKFTSLLN